MKREITICYFSPTGGCRRVAKSIDKELVNDRITVIDLTLPASRKHFPDLLNCDCLITVLPVYNQDLPDSIMDFLTGLRGKGAPAIIVSLYGNVHPGRALFHTAQILVGNGLKILGAASCPAAHSYNNENLSLAPGRPGERVLRQITDFIRDLLKELGAGSPAFLNPRTLPPSKNFLAYLPQKLIATFTVRKPDRVKKHCSGCLQCLNACPVAAINGSLEIDHKKCIRCSACVKACRQAARRIIFTSPVPYLYLSRWGRKERDICFFKAAP